MLLWEKKEETDTQMCSYPLSLSNVKVLESEDDRCGMLTSGYGRVSITTAKTPQLWLPA